MSRIFVDFFVWQYPKTLHGNPLVLCLRKIPLAKKFMDEWGRGEFKGFSLKVFCLTVPKNLVGESFGVSLKSGIEKC